MAATVVMPRLSDSMEEGKVTKWLKREGERIEKGEPVAEIETDKANMELESFDSGTVSKILVEEGRTVPVGQTIALIAAPGEEGVPAGPAEAGPAAAPAPERAAPPAPPAVEERGEIRASPLARRIAEEHGVDLSQVKGTGPQGRVVREDVENFIEEAQRPVEVKAPAAPPPGVAPEEIEVLELPRMGLTIAERMTRSTTTVPQFQVTTEADMTAVKRMRREINAALPEGKEVGFTDIILRAVALALRRFPRVNASFKEGKLEIKKRVNIGIAVALPDGLVVPVLKDVDRKTLLEIAVESKALIERARSARLAPGDYEGGTFSVSNLGMFDVDEFVAIINPPEAGILAVGSIKERAVVVEGQVVAALRMRMTLSADHRVYYGAMAAEFLSEIKRLLENPLSLVV